jgi:hypothetical protein
MAAMVPVVAAVPAAVFGVLVALHVICAIVGFGSIGLSGVYAAGVSRLAKNAQTGPSGEGEELRRFFGRPPLGMWAIAGVAPLGAGALAAQHHGGGFAQGWVVAALIVWVVACGVASGLVIPASRAIGATLAAESSDPTPDLAGLGRRVAIGAGACDVLFVVALALMIWQPR